MTDTCKHCGKEIIGGLRNAGDHLKCGAVVWDGKRIDEDEFYLMIDKIYEQAEHHRKKMVENMPSDKEIRQAVKLMDNDRSYRIEYHPLFSGYMNGKVWKKFYNVKLKS